MHGMQIDFSAITTSSKTILLGANNLTAVENNAVAVLGRVDGFSQSIG
jgi:hypothetical protein